MPKAHGEANNQKVECQWAVAMGPAGTGQKTYRFPEPLEEGTVLSRPNRFIMVVKVGASTIRCHCPTTGRLEEIRISSIPCLVSRAKGHARKTEATVEAISLDPPERRTKSWIGINQTAANRYVEFFLRTNQMPAIASGAVRREVRVGSSRIDFPVGETYVEVKTPLITLLMAEGGERTGHARFDSFDWLVPELDRANQIGRDLEAYVSYASL